MRRAESYATSFGTANTGNPCSRRWFVSSCACVSSPSARTRPQLPGLMRDFRSYATMPVTLARRENDSGLPSKLGARSISMETVTLSSHYTRSRRKRLRTVGIFAYEGVRWLRDAFGLYKYFASVSALALAQT